MKYVQFPVYYKSTKLKMFNISVNFKDTKEVDNTLESSLDFQTYFDAVYHLSEIKDDI